MFNRIYRQLTYDLVPYKILLLWRQWLINSANRKQSVDYGQTTWCVLHSTKNDLNAAAYWNVIVTTDRDLLNIYTRNL
jgi:hypothetical protein